MGYQIIKQPNGLWCIYSTVVDGFIILDATKVEIVKFYIDKAADRVREEVLTAFYKIETEEKPYRQFTISYEEALRNHIANHGLLDVV